MSNDMALAIIDNLQPEAVSAAMNKIASFQSIVQKTLKVDHDYGVIPGTQKPTLLKPGAEKILMLMGVTSEYEVIEQVTDYADGFFAYTVRATLSKGGVKITEGLGHANTRESRYTNRWVTSGKIPEGLDRDSLQTRERESKFKEGETYTEYLIANSDGFTLANTVLKMAKKRSQVDAVLTIASLSEIFTQDLEDLPDGFGGAPKQAKTSARRNSNKPTTPQPGDVYTCQGCGEQITSAVFAYSDKNFGRGLCLKCQDKAKADDGGTANG